MPQQHVLVRQNKNLKQAHKQLHLLSYYVQGQLRNMKKKNQAGKIGFAMEDQKKWWFCNTKERIRG